MSHSNTIFPCFLYFLHKSTTGNLIYIPTMQPKRCDTYLVQLAWVSFEMKQNNLHTRTYIKLEKGMKSIGSEERNNIDWCLTKKKKNCF